MRSPSGWRRLGALTKGERHSLSSDLFRPEDVTDEYGKAALARLYREIDAGRTRTTWASACATLERMGVLNKEKTAVRDNYASNVEQFLNRIMVLHVEKQNQIFELFYERYLEAVEAAKRQVRSISASRRSRPTTCGALPKPETLFVDPASGARTMLHELEGEVDVVRHTFASVAGDAQDGFLSQSAQRPDLWRRPHIGTAQRDEVFLTAVKGLAAGAGAAGTGREIRTSRTRRRREPGGMPSTPTRRRRSRSGFTS